MIKFIRLPLGLGTLKTRIVEDKTNSMLKKAIQWFRSPVFANDDEKTRKASLLNAVLNTFLLILPVLLISTMTRGTSRPEAAQVIIAASWLLIFGIRLVMNSGRVVSACIVTVTILYIATTLALLNVGTIRAPATSLYFLVIISAGLILGRRAIVWATGISGSTVLALLFAEQRGMLPPPDMTVHTTQGVTFVVVYTILGVLLYLAVKSIDDAMARAEQELAERMLAKEREAHRREMMQRVIRIGKTVAEKTPDLRTALLKIWNGIRNVLDFDRVGIFLYDPDTDMMQGTYGTDRSGQMSEEWDLKFGISDNNSFFRIVLSQPDGYYYTQDYETERGLLDRPGHKMLGVKHYAAVAVWAGNKPVALLIVDQLTSGRVITEEQLEALRFFAGYAGLAIENARLSERENKRREMMQKVIEIGKTVTEQTTDIRTALLKIRNSVRDVLDFDRAAVFLYHAEKDILQGTYGTDRSGNLTEEWNLQFDTAGIVFLQKVISRPDGFYYTQDYENDIKPWSPPDNIMEGVKHFVAVACWSEGKPIATICADQLLSGRPITEEQQEALRFFAGYAGLAIENARLIEHEHNRQKTMEQVINMGKESAEKVDNLRTALLKIRNSVQKVIGFDRTAIFLYDPFTKNVRGTYGTDRWGKLSEEWDLEFKPHEDGFLQRVLSRPDGFYFTEDYENQLHISSILDHPMRGVKQYVAAACWSGDKPIAIIVADQLLTNRPITEDQLEALRLFAGYAGLAIDNSRLNTELAERIIELGNRNAELERFTYTVSHDLRSPLVTIKGFVGMLNKDIHERQSDKVKLDMQRISNAADKMDSLLSDLLELSRIGRLVNPPEEIDLVKLTYDTLETVDGRLRAKNITTHVSPDLPTIYGDRIRFNEVMENLIDNAAKYMGDSPTPTIEIGTKYENGEQVIYVRDNGIGIEPQYLQKVFGLFDKLNPASEGTGIGLALIKRIIEVHGGRIWAESEGLGKGTTFYFTVPGNTPQKEK